MMHCLPVLCRAAQPCAAGRQAGRLANPCWCGALLLLPAADGTLVKAMQHVQPGLQQCSTQALCNLVWAAGMISASKTSGKSVRGTTGAVKPASWATKPAGLATAAAAVAGAAELALRSPQMKPAELAAVAVALAGHGAESAEVLPAAVLVTLRSACAAAAEELALTELAQLATAAARLRWVERGLVDSLARAIQARLSLHVCRSEVGALPCCNLGSPRQLCCWCGYCIAGVSIRAEGWLAANPAVWPPSSRALPGPQVFSQTVWALARLAPARYGSLFDSLALSYAAKLAHAEVVPVLQTVFEYGDRSTVLAAFAAVAEAQGAGTAGGLRGPGIWQQPEQQSCSCRHDFSTCATPCLLVYCRPAPEHAAGAAGHHPVW